MTRETNRRTRLLVIGTSALALSISPAWAQSSSKSSAPGADQQATDDASTPRADEIVVTGTSSRQTKFDAPYSVSTVDQQRIEDTAPHSVADLLGSIPGITIEASGGEGGGENIVIRGLPWSGWRLIDLNQDGMPLFESNFERYFNIDEIYRVDLDTKRAEIVRGGTAPVYSNNASGGLVNFITGHGSKNFEGAVRLETGTGNRIRGDVAVSGPLSDRLSATISGFYRRDDGLRDTGFKNADLGGQIKAGINYELDRGRIWADIKYLNDRSAFYTAVPITSPLNGESLERLIDPRDGTLTSNAFRRVTLRTIGANGQAMTVNRDLQDGIHPKTFTATLGGDYDLGGGFHLYNTYRHTDGTVLLNGLYNGAPTGAAAYLATRLGAAQSAFGNTVSSLRYVIAGTNKVYDPSTTANLVMPNTWASVNTKFRFDANDFHITKALETGLGKHTLTAGVYYSSYRLDQTQLLNAILTNVQTRPLALDVQALNSSGQVVGSVTENGFIAYGNGSQNGRVRGHSFAFYVADTWQITSAWSIDAGVRRVTRDQSGVQGVLGTAVANPNGPIPARTVTGVVREVARAEKPSGTSWTVGTGYVFSPRANVFARYTSTFSYPRFDNILGGSVLPNSTTPIPVSDIKQAEAGVKYAFPGLRLAATAFWSKFNVLNGGTQIADANGLITNSNIIFDTRTYGLELEAVATPFDGVEIVANGQIQRPIYTRVETLTGLDASSTKGGDVARVPRFQLSVEPAYSFEVGSMKARVFSTFFTIGRRFQDASNLSRLPAYSSFDLGASIATANGFELRGLISNVGNVVGLTEGNARSAAVLAGSVADASVGRSIFGRNFTLSLTKRW
ncbi:TonB-dependent receptor [Sphingobium indicum]|uniref:TonB-dependent receptor n=1 Tax=Sphingobium indicum TaxID=332055 RepID=UPI0017D85A01|nr:TonB-dependent receptor [Sphingobium indicum]NYI24242.1 outer membrane receptor protein involved in Fe transport [Sphingobium indicum]